MNKINKRGFELGWEFLFNLIFVIAIIVVVVIWIRAQANGDAIKKQVLAKEICILALEARPETTITIEHENNIIIEKQNFGVKVKKGSFDPGYFYPCYLKDNVEFLTKGNTTVIEIK